jgi:hypothetical protein
VKGTNYEADYTVGVRVAQSVQRLGYGLDGRGSIHGRDRDILSSPPLRPDRLGREADHSPPSSANIKTA